MGKTQCVVPGCGVLTTKYQFPSNHENVREEWLKRCGAPNILSQDKVCPKHFDVACITSNGRLRKYSVPSLFLDYVQTGEEGDNFMFPESDAPSNESPKTIRDQSSAFQPQVYIKNEIEVIEIKSEPIDSLNDYLIDVDRDLKPSSDFDIPVNNSSDISQEIVYKQERIYESTNDLPADPLQYLQPISTKNEENMIAQSNLSSDAPTVDSNTNSAIFEDPYFKRLHKPLRQALSRFFPLETAMFREKFEDNEDLLFILTLLADIKCVNKVDRLDLKADVLNVVKRYRNK